MAPDVERSTKSAPTTKLLTMDVIELTLLLKSIGFRLESIDYDEFRSWGKKSNDCGNNTSGCASSTTTTFNSGRSDADHHINVEISCSKSKIVSHLSFKINDSDTVATDAYAHSTTDTAKLMACSCPKRESRTDNNSFWEVQSSGTFVNQRRSINAIMNSEAGIDHDTSSNLLPMLSTKSIALTHVLTQVLLNQYKNNTQFGESNAKDVDIKSIMRAVERTSGNEKVGHLPPAGQVDDLNLITPLSSMNVTPDEQEVLMNVTIPKVTLNDRNTDGFTGKIAALNETVNTEAFGSPKSDLYTSSPHTSNLSVYTSKGGSSVVNLLHSARNSIDQALLSMRLDVTRNLSQEILTSFSTITRDIHRDNNPNRITTTQPGRVSNGRNTSQIATNVRPPIPTFNRRASLGSVVSKLPPKIVSSTTLTRSNVTKPKPIERPLSAASTKVALVRRAVSGIGNRTIGGITGLVKTPTTQQTNPVKRTASISRRTTSPAIVSNGTTPTNGPITRKTASSTKLTPLPSKLAKK